jgi:hypothetical protein
LKISLSGNATHRELTRNRRVGHAFTMTIQSVEAAAHGMHRSDSPWDIVMFVVIGGALLALLPAKQELADGAAMSEPGLAER